MGRPGKKTNAVVYGKYTDLLPKEYDDDDLARPTDGGTAGGMMTMGTREVQMVEIPKDPLEPPKFRIKRAPGSDRLRQQECTQ
eukprot:gene34869-50379_t